MLANLLIFLLSLSGMKPTPVDTLLDRADYYFEQNDTTVGFQFLDSALSVSESHDLAILRKVLNYYGYYHYRLGNLDESISYYRQALALDRERQDTIVIINRLKNIGIVYKAKGLPVLALQRYAEALSLAKQIDKSNSIASVSNSMGLLLSTMDEYPEALAHYRMARDIWIAEQDTLRLSYIYNNIGQLYYDRKQYDSALLNLQQAQRLKEKINEQKLLITTLHNIGGAYLAMDSLPLAQRYLYQSLNLAQSNQRAHEVAAIGNSLAQLYLSTSTYDSVRYYLDVVQQLNAEVGARTIRLKHLQLATQYWEAIGQPTRALAYHRQWAALQDSIYHEEHLQVVEMQAAYTLEQEELARRQAEQAAEQAQAESRRQKWLIALALAVLLVFTALIYRLFRLSRAYRRTSQQNEALVREQHHRVKNNLNVISSLLRMHARRLDDTGAKQAMQESQQRIQTMELIHRQLYGDEIRQVAMKDYLTTLVNSILSSYGHPAELRISIQECTLSVEKAVPVGLIVNEVVSNACKYAFPDHDQPELSVIFTDVADSSYQLTILDNGEGIDLEQAVNGASFGLKLIRLQTEQLRGQHAYRNQDGTCFELTFSV